MSGMSETAFTLSWEPSQSDGGSEIIEYIVEIKETKKTNWTVFGSSAGNVTNLVITNLIKDVAYDFRICARNEAGTSLYLTSEGEIVIGQKTSKFFIKLMLYIIYAYYYFNAFA